jgi:hypothetical protein
MDTLFTKLMVVAKSKGVTGVMISQTHPNLIAENLKVNEEDAKIVVGIVKGLLEAYPAAAQAPAWDEQTWNQFSKLVADKLPKPEPKAVITGLFEAEQTQPPQTEAKATTMASLKATVLLAARRIKASDPETYELYGLNQRSLEQLVKDAESRFTNGFKREDVEKFVMDKMSSAAEYREARGSIHDEAGDRNWTIAPRAKDGQPQTQTDYNGRVIGQADLAAILQAVQYDNLGVAEAFDALGFMPGAPVQKQQTQQPAQAGLFGS